MYLDAVSNLLSDILIKVDRAASALVLETRLKLWTIGLWSRPEDCLSI
jgi:hypothetical protein